MITLAEEQSNDIKIIVFQLGNEEYGIPVHQVRSIEKMQHITRVPGTKEFITGVMNLRGVVTPIIDLRSRFGIQEKPDDDATRIIIVSLEKMEAGFIVDAANDVLDLKADSFEPPPEVVGTLKAEYIDGVVKEGKRLLVMLNIESVLREKAIPGLQGA
ncbi:chemotaxis protein CheW [Bacillus lacus]|uniref:Chemotaxis protein CheW n=1 Tax=Metabacillus lacus TaxID=1983721 RepID=A0A7X2IVZ1_9BACI|nr:chemotaxis protein CheW [Metabacillus lacus]MRX70615.1 chemotaxis protein CheW [Metabacillus lacus]